MLARITRCSSSGPQLLQRAIEKVNNIKQRMKANQDRQISYANIRIKELQFVVGDKVYLKVCPTKGVVRFGSTGNLKPRYIGPFDFIAKVGDLALPPNHDIVHNAFYISMLKKYARNEIYIIHNYMELDIQPNATYEEKSLKILDRRDRVLKTKIVPPVKVLWNNRGVEDACCKRKRICKKNTQIVGRMI